MTKIHKMGEPLKIWLKQHHTNMRMLSEGTSISHNMATRYANGSAMPPSDKLRELADSMCVSMDDAYFLLVESREW